MDTNNNRTIAMGMSRFKWGNEINANYAGTTAQLRGDDLLTTIRNGAITDPEPFPIERATDSSMSFPPGISAEQVPEITEKARQLATGEFFPNFLKGNALLLLALLVIGIGLYAVVK